MYTWEFWENPHPQRYPCRRVRVKHIRVTNKAYSQTLVFFLWGGFFPEDDLFYFWGKMCCNALVSGSMQPASTYCWAALAPSLVLSWCRQAPPPWHIFCLTSRLIRWIYLLVLLMPFLLYKCCAPSVAKSFNLPPPSVLGLINSKKKTHFFPN